MSAQLAPEVEKKVIAAAKSECGQAVESASVGRLLFTYRHCGGRMAKVEIFGKRDPSLPYSDANRQRGTPVAVCTHPTCNQVTML